MIIFDLDDTLIHTSSSITPVKLKNAFFKMIQAGLVIKNKQKELLYLKELDKKTLSAKETLKKFLQKHRAMEYLDLGVAEVYSDIEDISIIPQKNVNKILQELQVFYRLALVTIGKENIQREKLKKAGIDCSVFCMMEFLNKKDKKSSYQKIMRLCNIPASKVAVCGDRIETDLQPAKRLRLKTIQMKCGRGFNSIDTHGIVDHEIYQLSEIKKIMEHYRLEKNDDNK